MTKRLKYIVICAAILGIVALISSVRHYKEVLGQRDYDDIESEGVINVIVEDNKMSYITIQCDTLVECDSLEGLQVKMVEDFARRHSLNVKFISERNLDKAMEMLMNNQVDLLAWHLPVYNDMKETVSYTIPVFTSRQKLVQRRRKPGVMDTTLFIVNQLDLAGQHLYVAPGSIFKHRLHYLEKEIGDTIYLHEIPDSNDDMLFRMVSDSVINYFVCDEFVARVLQKDYPNVDISTAISFTQNYSWGVRHGSPDLLDSLNSWLAVYLESKAYNKIYRKYTGVK
ncbi:MAG: transporter substrate-binding domain-containing protein [Paludibacteraceae bacterium]|nr:transporter substrate-binding domain-containing protein [Paludibacteraceae bacterium]